MARNLSDLQCKLNVACFGYHRSVVHLLTLSHRSVSTREAHWMERRRRHSPGGGWAHLPSAEASGGGGVVEAEDLLLGPTRKKRRLQ
ncbi:hypothetical protein CEXT_749481 [Caerostris extrusa]|uniref:Uncharacterized protein n=1 Tax=Caerostris extrusa TaxID=172846 RepID=A0AAV4RA08_CAEEX|nr:hypothetical protein CEXT_749481 [Caerostris extrusa]